MTTAKNDLTETERQRIGALQRVFSSDSSARAAAALLKALQKDRLFSAGNARQMHTHMLSAFQDATALPRWLEQFPRTARQRAGRGTIGHLLPGNHPGAVLSALLPGWLLGCRQIVRPSPRLARYTAALVAQVDAAFRQAMPLPPPRCTVQHWDHRAPDSSDQLRAFLRACDVVTVQGSDFTVAAIQAARQALPTRQQPALIAFASRISILAIDCNDVNPEPQRPQLGPSYPSRYFKGAKTVAQHLVLANQKGCLCPHGVMLIGSKQKRSHWLDCLTSALFRQRLSREKMSAEERLAVSYQHRVYLELSESGQAGFSSRELGMNGTRGRLWKVPLSEPPTALTGRSYSIWQADTVTEAARAIAAWPTPLQAIGCLPGPEPFAKAFAPLGAWVTAASALHAPPPDWPQDGCDLLTRLVKIADRTA